MSDHETGEQDPSPVGQDGGDSPEAQQQHPAPENGHITTTEHQEVVVVDGDQQGEGNDGNQDQQQEDPESKPHEQPAGVTVLEDESPAVQPEDSSQPRQEFTTPPAPAEEAEQHTGQQADQQPQQQQQQQEFQTHTDLATSSSDQDRSTISPPPLWSVEISEAAHSRATRQALLSQITDSTRDAVLQCVKKEIDRLMEDNGLKNWAGWEPIVRVAKHQGRVERSPIELTSADVEAVGSRAVFDGRCEALRQLSLIQRHLGVTLGRDNNGEEQLDGRRLTIRPLHTLPDDLPFRDPANPVCAYDGVDYVSVRDAVSCRMAAAPAPPAAGSAMGYLSQHNAPMLMDAAKAKAKAKFMAAPKPMAKAKAKEKGGDLMDIDSGGGLTRRAADLPQPQMLPSSHERYKTGTRVLLTSSTRRGANKSYVWLKADVYRTEEAGGATRVSMREIEGTEEFTVVVPHQAKASPHGQQVHKGFRFVENVPVEQPVDEDTDNSMPRLFKLLEEVEKGVLFPLLGGDLAVSLARIRTTCRLGRERVSADLLRSLIDAQLAAKDIQDIISYDLPSVGHLLRLVYFIDNSGEWEGWEPIVRVAKHQGRVERLPIEVGSADVEGVSSRAVFDGRCEALRQLSLIQRHLGVTLERVDGEERLGVHRLTIRTLHTMWADHPFRNGYDPKNPVCEYYGIEFFSVRNTVLYEMQDARPPCGQRQLATQPPPVWGCHTISTTSRGRMIVLHGDQPDHTFAAHLYVDGGYATVYLRTTEPPMAGKEGAARFPQTVKVVREVMGAADAVRMFGSQLDVALPPADGGGGGEGGGQSAEEGADDVDGDSSEEDDDDSADDGDSDEDMDADVDGEGNGDSGDRRRKRVRTRIVTMTTIAMRIWMGRAMPMMAMASSSRRRRRKRRRKRVRVWRGRPREGGWRTARWHSGC
ncbi:unnamed protein product [Vitrella brassicaformis CCMP3155]|uniref:Uncharacterized protein n=1 Tax=Vitrella brassicaformis (strain CCMP3155) TaxID=1169540 RepID=A0A0G4EVN8_VITBC|nr:unnamed protein product [Vitrella brassicaformis CCMP3155]|eukprot:CEM02487.1 unnamed protein product [Vitrella brassicaformis CCMP3155]